MATLGKLLGDAFNAVKDDQDRNSGARKNGTGRRPPRFASLDVVLETVFPTRFSMDPFPEAFRKLLGERSQRQFALKSGISQGTLSKLLAGEQIKRAGEVIPYRPDMAIMERIAEHAKVSPGYFLEYRALFLAELVGHVLSENPQMSSIVLRDFMRLRERDA
jgi:transcriptional regulator with XRE-family HTH domain